MLPDTAACYLQPDTAVLCIKQETKTPASSICAMTMCGARRKRASPWQPKSSNGHGALEGFPGGEHCCGLWKETWLTPWLFPPGSVVWDPRPNPLHLLGAAGRCSYSRRRGSELPPPGLSGERGLQTAQPLPGTEGFYSHHDFSIYKAVNERGR